MTKVEELLKKKRTFLISFCPKEKLAFGNIIIENKIFPSYKLILKEIKNNSDFINDIVIINIYEFKNDEDYNNYIK